MSCSATKESEELKMHGDIRKRTNFVNKLTWRHGAIVVIVFILLLDMPLLVQGAKTKKKNPECSVCKDICTNFQEGLSKTKKSGHGGGNTNWEEKSLKSYPKSEVRLVEIIEDHLCKRDSKACQSMREEYEEYLENFWFHEFSKNEKADLFQWFCIDKIKACCKENLYGPDCKPCLGDPDRPCFGNGKCDGEGTRGGTGECRCNAGYRGDKCDECSDGYFEQHKNDTHIICKACHISCKETCTEDGPMGCEQCKTGWLESEKEGCTDIDECKAETSPCKDNEYCVNTAGSYSCFSCDISCVGCTGGGDSKCRACSLGFYQEGGQCLDIDECAADSSLCSGTMERCVNEPSTYMCQCVDGFQRNSDDKCVQKPKDDGELDDKEDGDEDEDDNEKKDDENIKDEL